MRKSEKAKSIKAQDLQVQHTYKMEQKKNNPKASPEPTASLYGNRHNRRRARALTKALACAEELIALKDLELNSITAASAILDDHETRIVALEP